MITCDDCGGPMLVEFAVVGVRVVDIEPARGLLSPAERAARDEEIRKAPRREMVVGACCASGRRRRAA